MSGSISTVLLHGAPCCLVFLETREAFAMETPTAALGLSGGLRALCCSIAAGGRWELQTLPCLTNHLTCPSVTCPFWLPGVDFGGGEKWELCKAGLCLGCCWALFRAPLGRDIFCAAFAAHFGHCLLPLVATRLYIGRRTARD